MNIDTRIPVPSFDVAVAALLEVVAESPQATHRHAYLDNRSIPFDLTATWLARLDAPIVRAAQGAYMFNGMKLFNNAHVHRIWNRLFTGYTPAGDRTVYDERNIWFAMENVDDAEAYLVYALANRVQRANDAGLDWRGAAVRALKSTRRFLHHKQSGPRVQLGIHPATAAHEKMWQNIDSTIAKALATLSK